MAVPREIPAIAPELRLLLLPEGADVASGFDEVGVVVEADEVRLIDDDFWVEDA